jgi:AAA domain
VYDEFEAFDIAQGLSPAGEIPSWPSFITPDDLDRIPPRAFVFGEHFIRKQVTLTIAPGGVGKTSLIMAEALSMTSGRDLIGIPVAKPLRVWLVNEDPIDELRRRVKATAAHYRVPFDELGALALDSSRDVAIIIAKMRDGSTTIDRAVFDRLCQRLIETKIDVLILDPFGSFHRSDENDNSAIKAVIDALAKVADKANCAIHIVHHSRKTNGGETGTEDSRGASALIDTARSTRSLNRMSDKEAKAVGIANRGLFFRVDKGKANLTAPAEHATWYRLASVDLNNATEDHHSDRVGVVEPWSYPDASKSLDHDIIREIKDAIGTEPKWKENAQATEWAGNAIIDLKGEQRGDVTAQARAKTIIRSLYQRL